MKVREGREVVALFFLISTFLVGCARVGVDPPPPPVDLPPPGVGPVEIPSAEDEPRDRAPVADTGAAPEASLQRGGTRLPLPPSLPTETGNVRALWVVRTALLHPDSARAAVRRAADAGFNTLLVQVRGRGDAYYRSAYEPPPDAMDRGWIGVYDPLEVVLEEARLRGLRVHAWINLNLVASAVLPPRDLGHLFHRAPETLAIPRALAPRLLGMSPSSPGYRAALLEWTRGASDRVEGIYTNPSHPEVRMHQAALVRDLIERYPLDGIHFDYVRYPGPEFDYSRHSLDAFRGWIQGEQGQFPAGRGPGGAERGPVRGGVDPARLIQIEAAWRSDPFAYVDGLPAEWDAFRTAQVRATLETLYWVVKDHRPEMLVSAAVFANADDARSARYQDWEEWLRAGIVEVVAPMAYTESDDTFRRQIDRAARAVGPERVWAGVGIYRNSFESAVRKGRISRELGAGGVVLFSYDWAVGPEGRRAAGGEYLPRFVSAVWGGR